MVGEKESGQRLVGRKKSGQRLVGRRKEEWTEAVDKD